MTITDNKSHRVTDRPVEIPQKIVYEWVLTLSKGDDAVLTENQYEVYKRQVQEGDMRRLFFSDFEVNPSFVTTANRQKANYIKNKYLCKACYGGGRNPDNTGWCPNCEGSCVDIPK